MSDKNNPTIPLPDGYLYVNDKNDKVKLGDRIWIPKIDDYRDADISDFGMGVNNFFYVIRPTDQ